MRSRKSKRTPGMEEARPFAGMSQINEGAAGVDIGAQELSHYGNTPSFYTQETGAQV
jgi:hypothetical protein